MTVREAIGQAAETVKRRDAELLLRHVLGWDLARLRSYPEAQVAESDLQRYRGLVVSRAKGTPVQYLTLQQEFYGLALTLSPDVLIPRPETEGLVEAVLTWAAQASVAPVRHIADVGTGSGAIALALAAHLPDVHITALDLSPNVQGVVEQNALTLQLAGRVTFLQSDLLGSLAGQVQAGLRMDVVVSNPPYIPILYAPELASEVRDHEPHMALFAGRDGLEIYRRLIPEAWQTLRVGGLLAMEFGYNQHDAMAGLLVDWRDVRFETDLAGIPRVVTAVRP